MSANIWKKQKREQVRIIVNFSARRRVKSQYKSSQFRPSVCLSHVHALCHNSYYFASSVLSAE